MTEKKLIEKKSSILIMVLKAKGECVLTTLYMHIVHLHLIKSVYKFVCICFKTVFLDCSNFIVVHSGDESNKLNFAILIRQSTFKFRYHTR